MKVRLPAPFVAVFAWTSGCGPRFFQTRSLTPELVESGRDGREFEVELQLLSNIRGLASVAQTLYRETEFSRETRRDFSSLKNVARACFQVLLPRTDPPSVIGEGSCSQARMTDA